MDKVPLDDSICEMLNPTGIYAIDVIAKNVDCQIRNTIKKNMNECKVSVIRFKRVGNVDYEQGIEVFVDDEDSIIIDKDKCIVDKSFIVNSSSHPEWGCLITNL